MQWKAYLVFAILNKRLLFFFNPVQDPSCWTEFEGGEIECYWVHKHGQWWKTKDKWGHATHFISRNGYSMTCHHVFYPFLLLLLMLSIQSCAILGQSMGQVSPHLPIFQNIYCATNRCHTDRLYFNTGERGRDNDHNSASQNIYFGCYNHVLKSSAGTHHR